jgi:hypothetical protein
MRGFASHDIAEGKNKEQKRTVEKQKEKANNIKRNCERRELEKYV